VITKSNGAREIDLEKSLAKKEAKEARRAIRRLARDKKRSEDRLIMYLHPWAGR